jgi:hypothetical protein
MRVLSETICGPARTIFCSCLLVLFVGAFGCTPKVQLEAPKEPIVINLNIKIEHEIKVKVDKDLENLFEDDEDLF